MNLNRWVVLFVCGSAAGFGQTAPTPLPQFEVASIRPSPPGAPAQLSLGLRIDGAQVSLRQFALKDELAVAFNVKQYQISGPDWLATERFDIVAKLPDGAPRDQVRPMLQALLVDRFQMKTHHETRDFPVYALVVAKGGLKMKELPPDPASGEGTDGDNGGNKAGNAGNVNVAVSAGRGGAVVSYGNGAYFSMGSNRFEAKRMQMRFVADMLARFTDKPVVDMTGLEGRYDFTLDFTQEDFRAMMIRAAIASGMALPPEAIQLMESASGDSLFAALQTLGLKLDSRKAPLEVLVVDHAEKTPTEN